MLKGMEFVYSTDRFKEYISMKKFIQESVLKGGFTFVCKNKDTYWYLYRRDYVEYHICYPMPEERVIFDQEHNTIKVLIASNCKDRHDIARILIEQGFVSTSRKQVSWD